MNEHPNITNRRRSITNRRRSSVKESLILLYSLLLPVGVYMYMVSSALTDSPSTAKFMEVYIKVYWSIGIVAYILAICYSIVMYGKEEFRKAIIMAAVAFVMYGTPFIVALSGFFLSQLSGFFLSHFKF